MLGNPPSQQHQKRNQRRGAPTKPSKMHSGFAQLQWLVRPIRLLKSIMVTRLQKINSILADQVNNAMLLREAARPCTGRKMLQWLRLSDAGKRFSQNGFNQIKSPKCRLSVRFDPITKIFPKLGMKYGTPRAIRVLGFWLTLDQAPPLYEGLPQMPGRVLVSGHEPTQSGAFQRFSGNAEDERSP